MIVRLVLNLMGQTSMAPHILNEANHEIQRQYLDCTKARRLLNWQPAYTLADGLLETIAWYQDLFPQEAGQTIAVDSGGPRA